MLVILCVGSSITLVVTLAILIQTTRRRDRAELQVRRLLGMAVEMGVHPHVIAEIVQSARRGRRQTGFALDTAIRVVRRHRRPLLAAVGAGAGAAIAAALFLLDPAGGLDRPGDPRAAPTASPGPTTGVAGSPRSHPSAPATGGGPAGMAAPVAMVETPTPTTAAASPPPIGEPSIAPRSTEPTTLPTTRPPATPPHPAPGPTAEPTDPMSAPPTQTPAPTDPPTASPTPCPLRLVPIVLLCG